MRTPYDKLRSLPNAETHLKPGVTFADLDAEAHAISDLQAARALNTARDRLFQTIGRDPARPPERTKPAFSTA